MHYKSMLLPFIYLTISTYHHQIPNITNMGLTARKIKKAAIIGGGLMGSGIATILILNNFNVVLKEVNEQFLSAGINRIKGIFYSLLLILLGLPSKFLRSLFSCSANLQSFVKKGQLTVEDYKKKLSLLCGVLDYEQFRDTDVVIEVDPISIFTTL